MAGTMPKPDSCIHDKGGEFTGFEFQRMLQQNGIRDAPTTSRNPQSNAVCEWMHQTVANVLRTLLKTNPPRNVQDAEELLIDSSIRNCNACNSVCRIAILGYFSWCNGFSSVAFPFLICTSTSTNS
jgi:transposase InsO family protein